VIVGLLPEVAGDLGVSIPTAGLLVTSFALSVVFGGPVLTIATVGMPRRALLLALMAVFVLGNACVALKPGYWTFGEDRHLVLDERAVGVAVAAIALALRTPVLLAVALAAATTALARAFV
jgi:DHA1 family inner membrane transport protein